MTTTGATTGITLRRRLGAGATAALVAASMTLAAPAPVAAAQAAGPFPDTPAGAFYTPAVEALHQNGVFAGTLCNEGFCPDEPLDRATMAVWTVRVLDKKDPPAVTSTRFADVEAAHRHAAFIERFAELRVTQGCGDGTNYCPDDGVSRAHMAVFLSRAFELAAGPDPDFSDVDADAWFAPDVARLAASGITRGCGDGTNFCPDGPTTRAHMATFLARALGLVKTPGASTGTGASSGFTSISAGNQHACAVRADKSLECWGRNLDRRLDAPRGEFLAVSAGGFHTCALRADNTLSCWGDGSDGQLRRPRGEFLSVSSGFKHTCAVSATEGSEGSVQCWGLDILGEATPTAGSYRKVSAGHEHTCGLTTSGTIQCWGGNGHGQAGTEDPTGPMICTASGCRRGYSLQQYPPQWGPFIDVSAGTVHTCAVQAEGVLKCWGEREHGQAFPPFGFAFPPFGFVDGEYGEFVEDGSGEFVKDGSGRFVRAESGDYKFVARSFVAVSAGFKHSCALTVDGEVRCWGRDEYGETQAPAGEFVAVSAGSSFSCGLRPDSSIECWGYNGDGQATPPTS